MNVTVSAITTGARFTVTSQRRKEKDAWLTQLSPVQ